MAGAGSEVFDVDKSGWFPIIAEKQEWLRFVQRLLADVFECCLVVLTLKGNF